MKFVEKYSSFKVVETKLPDTHPNGYRKLMLMTFLINLATVPFKTELKVLTNPIKHELRTIKDTRSKITPTTTSLKDVLANKKSLMSPSNEMMTLLMMMKSSKTYI